MVAFGGIVGWCFKSGVVLKLRAMHCFYRVAFIWVCSGCSVLQAL